MNVSSHVPTEGESSCGTRSPRADVASCRGEAKKPSRQPPVSAALRDRRRILPSACSWTRQRPAGSLELPGEVPVVFRMVKKIHQSPPPSSCQVDRAGASVLRRRCPCAIRSSRAGHRRHLGRLPGGNDLPHAIDSRGASVSAASCVCVCIQVLFGYSGLRHSALAV